jgi:glycosyltransferase involved in cell wall biosynthesis
MAGAPIGGKSLVTFELRDPDPDVMVVTNAWPHPEDPTYGIFIKRQVESLRELGVRVDVLFVRGYISKLAYVAGTLSLWSLSRRARPGYRLVHAHGGESVLSALGYRRAPILLSYLGLDLLGTRRADGSVPSLSRLRRAILRRSAVLVNHTITKSYEMQLALPRSVRSRNDVVPSGVDESVFVPVARDHARQLLGWNATARIALFGGNPHRVPDLGKRFWLAEAACGSAAGRLSDLRLETLGGVDPARVPLLMSAADCLVLTSISEGSPNVVKEALMCNLPVISTPVGDVTDLLRDVSPSWVCEPSVDAIADALVECLSNPTRSNGRSKSQHLTTRSIADRVLRVYEDIIGRQSPEQTRSPGALLPASPAPTSSRETGER